MAEKGLCSNKRRRIFPRAGDAWVGGRKRPLCSFPQQAACQSWIRPHYYSRLEMGGPRTWTQNSPIRLSMVTDASSGIRLHFLYEKESQREFWGGDGPLHQSLKHTGGNPARKEGGQPYRIGGCKNKCLSLKRRPRYPRRRKRGGTFAAQSRSRSRGPRRGRRENHQKGGGQSCLVLKAIPEGVSSLGGEIEACHVNLPKKRLGAQKTNWGGPL